MPMQFIQSYGLRDTLPLGIFSFLAKQRRERNRRLGLIDDVTSFHFGNVLFTTTLVAASVGAKADSWMFLPGLVILSGWFLISTGRGRLSLLLPVLAVAGLIGWSGRIGLEKIEDMLGQSSAPNSSNFNPNYTSTLIGTAGTVQQSSDIIWRLRANEGNPPPRLLRRATYNFFLGNSWRNQRVVNADFKDLNIPMIGGVPYYQYPGDTPSQDPSKLPGFTLRGSAALETPLPLPGDWAMMRDFELDAIEVNSFGTVRVFPRHPVIEGTVFWKGDGNPESPPLPHEDLQIPSTERKAIRETIEQLGITKDTTPREQLAIIRSFFLKNFRYTRKLSIGHSSSRANGTTAIANFLTDTRAGHCEYFATAAVLMLREAGVPARYATGYGVIERDMKRGGHIIRGTHGHAWCRVWDAGSGRWIDFDPTPPDWLAIIPPAQPWMQQFNDNLKRLREDFFLWRNRPGNRLGVSLTMTGIGLALAGFVTRRLWRSRRRLESAMRLTGYTGPITRTPLHEIETSARKILGERPPGETFARWLDRLRTVLDDGAVFDEAIALHQRLRFDPAPPLAADQERLAKLTARLETAIKSHRRFPNKETGRA
jgi:transglutaminase-like putative cysteine protease